MACEAIPTPAPSAVPLSETTTTTGRGAAVVQAPVPPPGSAADTRLRVTFTCDRARPFSVTDVGDPDLGLRGAGCDGRPHEYRFPAGTGEMNLRIGVDGSASWTLDLQLMREAEG